MQNYDIETLAVRAGIARSQFNEHSEALYLTSSFVFDSAAQAAARFQGSEPGNIYSRFTNPTVTAFQERLAALEGAEACVATASGMSAILATAMALLKSGDHIVSSSGVFGATVQLFSNLLSKFGVETSYVDESAPSAWKAALRANTKLLYVETPSNPLTEVFDIRALADLQPGAAAPDRARGRSRRSFRHQVPRRAGQGPWRRDSGAARAGDGRHLRFPAHRRPQPVAVQRLGAAQRAGNPQDTHGSAVTECARARALAGVASPRAQGLLPWPVFPSAVQARGEAAALGRRSGVLRGPRRPRSRVEGRRLDAPHLDHGEPGRHQDHHHASRNDHP